MKQIRSAGIRIEILGGEPLLRKDIADIVGFSKTIARSPFTTLYTNGTNATKTLSRKLKQAGLDAAIVTLISTDPKVHDSFTHKNNSWDMTIRGIRNLQEASIKVYTFTAIHKKNAHDIENIHNFVIKKLKAHALFYQYIPQVKNDPLVIDRNTWYRLKNLVLAENPEHAEFVRNFYMLTGNACSGGLCTYRKGRRLCPALPLCF